jgi:hypothetical protein
MDTVLPNAVLSPYFVKATARDGLWLTIAQFVTAITAKVRRSGIKGPRQKGGLYD